MIIVTTKKSDRECGNANVMRYRSTIYERTELLSPKHFRYRGFGLVWTALVIFALFLFVGLSIDWAKLLYNLHELQNAADAAALAGAQIVKVEPADVTRQWAHDLGYANKTEKLEVTLRTETVQDDPFPYPTDWDDPVQKTAYEAAMAPLDIILGRWINHQRYFFPTLDTPDAVEVIARRATGLTDAPALALLFGPLVSVYDADAIRVAIGWYNEASGAGLIVLEEKPVDKIGKPTPGLLIADNVGDIRVIGGSIQVNAIWDGTMQNNDPPAAVYVKGGGRLQCARLTVTGHTDPEPGLNDWDKIWRDDDGNPMPYDIWEGAPYMPDPLRDLVPPSIGDYAVRSYVTNTPGTLEPGYYPDGIVMTKAAPAGLKVILKPGTYIIGGGHTSSQDDGLIQTGGELEGYGVLIYLTKDYMHTDGTGKWAQLDIGGEVITTITPPGDLPENYVNGKPVINGRLGVSIWQDKENTENQAELSGGGKMNISGTLYFPKNHVYLAGNPGKTGNQILCGSVEVFGRAQIVVEYDGRNNQNKGISVLVQ